MSTPLQHLQHLLDFSEADLNANRRGRLSTDQIAFLQRKADHDMYAVIIIPFCIVVGIFLLLDFWLSLPAILLISALIAGLYALHQRALDDIGNQKVIRLTGKLERVPRTSSLTHYAIRLEGERFTVDREFYYSVPEGYYSLYLLAGSRQILGMESAKGSARAAQRTGPQNTGRASQTRHAQPRQRATGRRARSG